MEHLSTKELFINQMCAITDGEKKHTHEILVKSDRSTNWFAADQAILTF